MKRSLAYFALFLTCLIPAFAGVYGGATLVLEWTWAPAFLRDRVDNLPLFGHVIGSATFYLLAALQVVPRFRKRYPTWHRRAGRVAVAAGVLGAATSIWLTVVHPGIAGPVLYYGRLVFGPVWLLCLVLGVLAIRRRDLEAHRGWMIRAFAVAMPAGTLIFIVMPFVLVMGELPQALEETIQSCAWIVHLSIAELVIRRLRPSNSNLFARKSWNVQTGV